MSAGAPSFERLRRRKQGWRIQRYNNIIVTRSIINFYRCAASLFILYSSHSENPTAPRFGIFLNLNSCPMQLIRAFSSSLPFCSKVIRRSPRYPRLRALYTSTGTNEISMTPFVSVPVALEKNKNSATILDCSWYLPPTGRSGEDEYLAGPRIKGAKVCQ